VVSGLSAGQWSRSGNAAGDLLSTDWRLCRAVLEVGRRLRKSSGQLVKEFLGVFEVKRVMAFGEPAVDWSQQIVGLIPLAPIT